MWVNTGTASGSVIQRLRRFSNNTNAQVDPLPRAISIGYYSKSAPLGLMIAAGVLAWRPSLYFPDKDVKDGVSPG